MKQRKDPSYPNEHRAKNSFFVAVVVVVVVGVLMLLGVIEA